MPSGNYMETMCQLWLLQQNPKEKTWAAPLWRSIHICKKGLYHKPIQLGTHLQAVAVQVTLGGSPVTILSVYIPSSDHLTTQDLSRLIRGLNGQILIIGDFNGHSYSWGNLNNDTRGDVIERFTDRNILCILNDGSPTYLKPQAQHSQNPKSAIDLSICTPGLALKCAWEVLPDTHGSNHYPILISMPSTSGDMNQGGDPSHWVFSKADWEQFAELCMDKITGDILHDQDPFTSFVGHVIDAATDSIPRATTVLIPYCPFSVVSSMCTGRWWSIRGSRVKAGGQKSEAGESLSWASCDDSCFCPEWCDKTLVVVWFVVFTARNCIEAATIGVPGGMVWTGVGAGNLGIAARASGCAYRCACILVKRCPRHSKPYAVVVVKWHSSSTWLMHAGPAGVWCMSSGCGLLHKLWSGEQHPLVQCTKLWWLAPTDVLRLLLHVSIWAAKSDGPYCISMPVEGTAMLDGLCKTTIISTEIGALLYFRHELTV